MNAAAVALLIATVSALTLISPATAADGGSTGQPDDMVAPVKWSLWPYKHVHISNELGDDKSMMVHCKGKKFPAKKEDLGVHYVGDGSEYTWRFKPVFLGVTRYSCYLSPVGGDVAIHVNFDAYVSRDPSIIEHKNNVYWAVRGGGVYLRDVTGATPDVLRYVWVPGKLNEIN